MTNRRFLLVVAAMLAAAGCGAGPAPASPQPARHLTVQQLADAVGCRADVTGKTSGFRQANCTVDGSPFVLLDFDTAQGQREWLDDAESYGGTYLVGERWALAGSTDRLHTLQATLGGRIEEAPA